MQDPIDNSTVYWRVILGKYLNYYYYYYRVGNWRKTLECSWDEVKRSLRTIIEVGGVNASQPGPKAHSMGYSHMVTYPLSYVPCSRGIQWTSGNDLNKLYSFLVNISWSDSFGSLRDFCMYKLIHLYFFISVVFGCLLHNLVSRNSFFMYH